MPLLSYCCCLKHVTTAKDRKGWDKRRKFENGWGRVSSVGGIFIENGQLVTICQL